MITQREISDLIGKDITKTAPIKLSHAKINQEIADNIRKDFSKGNITKKDLAEKYGLTLSHLSRVIHNRAWTGKATLFKKGQPVFTDKLFDYIKGHWRDCYIVFIWRDWGWAGQTILLVNKKEKKIVNWMFPQTYDTICRLPHNYEKLSNEAVKITFTKEIKKIERFEKKKWKGMR